LQTVLKHIATRRGEASRVAALTEAVPFRGTLEQLNVNPMTKVQFMALAVSRHRKSTA
jgi:hypothetical protein